MTRREYLKRLREQAPRRTADAIDPRTPILPVTSPAVEDALARIARQVGLTEEQVATRFPGRASGSAEA